MKYFKVQRLLPIINLNSRYAATGISRRCSSEAAAAVAAADGGGPLLDRHGRVHSYLRVSLTERCNLRCQYCMPAGGAALSARSALLTRPELERVVRALVGAGVARVRLTGGEPTLRPDLELVLQDMAAAGAADLAMTSNGVALARRLPALQRAGLARLNLSLDSLRPERYERMARRPGSALARVLATADTALQLGLTLKINVVLIKGFNDDEISDFVELTRDRALEVRFIEFMPFAGNEWSAGGLVAHRAALAAARARHHLRPAPARDHDTAQLWRAAGHAGTVGFISSMTRPFCASCNRLRLTADGSLKVCLFGAAELSLRDALRAGASDAELLALVRAALRNKHAQHAGEWRAGASAAPRAPPAPLTLTLPRAARGGAGARGPPHGAHRRLAAPARAFCSRAGDGPLPHLDGAGRARMVDVGGKAVTARAALAECRLEVSPRVLRLLRARALPKGDALCVARVAGTAAAKRAADLLPLCHPLALDAARVQVELPPGEAGAVLLRCEVRCTARTGAEMEALTGAAVAALALYDMCKAVDKDMRITGLRLVSKTGGRSSPPQPAPEPPLRPPAAAARRADDDETYAPTNFMNF